MDSKEGQELANIAKKKEKELLKVRPVVAQVGSTLTINSIITAGKLKLLNINTVTVFKNRIS